MITEKSCGAVVFTRTGSDIRYLIIQSKEGIYGFPKGHVEDDETEQQTACREIKEETGLDVCLIDGFRTEDVHLFQRNDEQRIKYIGYFLAEYSDQIPVAQHTEVDCIRLLEYDVAMTVFQYESSKRILTEANEFLRNFH